MGEGNSKEATSPEIDGAYPLSSSTSKLIEAASKGQVETVAKLLKKDKKVDKIDKKDEKGDTALHKAAMHGHYEVADMLLKKGALASSTNNEGFTPFQFAVLNGQKECAKLLLEHGKDDVNAQFKTNPGISLDYSINKASGVYVWRISDFTKIKERRVYSEIFSIVGQKWRLVVYPQGSKGDENLSCYLEMVDHETLPEGWCTLADFSFSVLNQLEGTKKIAREVSAHRFYKNHTDLGFPQLIKKTALKDKKSGYLVNDTLIIEFLIEVLENTTYALDEFSGVHTWKMIDLGTLQDRATSSMFKIGSCRWVTAVYPHGKGGGTNLSVYLKVAEPMALPSGWSYLVNFRFAVVNQKDGSKFSRHVESKNFKQKVEDWGFPQFMKLAQLHEEDAGHVKDNTVLVEVQVEIIRDSKRKKNKLNSNDPSSCLFTPLHWATYKGAADGVKLLLEGGANVCATDARGRSPLDWAAYLGDLAVATILIEMGAKATCYDSEGFTPFHKAVLNGHTPLIQLLIDAGADVNAKSLNNSTPLQLAFRSNRIEIAECLITKYGADLNCTDKNGRTPLHWAAFNADIDTITFLLTAGADINAQDGDGYTPLHKSVWKGRLDCVKHLLEFGADPTIASNKGLTPLHIAVQANDIPCTIELLEHGDDANSRDADGLTLLHKGVQNGNLCLVETLLKWGADLSLTNVPHCPTLLQIAIANSDISTCIFLLEHGADIQGNTAALLQFVARKSSYFADDVPVTVNTLSSDLRTLVNNSQFHDVTFMLDEKPVYAWRGILSARSDYFRAMFDKPSWKESSEATIPVMHVSHRTFLAVIVYIYTGEIDMPISVEDALSLLAAANKYILPRLKTMCEKILVKVLTVENVFSIFRHADMHMSFFLHKACVQYIAENIDQSLLSDELDDILKADSFTECVVAFLRSKA